MMLMQFFSLISYLLTVSDEVSDATLGAGREHSLLSLLSSCVLILSKTENLFVRQVGFHKRTVFPRIGVKYSMR